MNTLSTPVIPSRLGGQLARALAVTLFALGVTTSAQAALVNCPNSFTTDGTAKVHDGSTDFKTAASLCQYIDPPNSSTVASLDAINTAGFFSTTNWQENGQTQVEDGVGLTGSWTISNVNFADYDYMIVFKDGANTNLTAFLFNEVYTSGGWSTPFVNPPFEVGDNGRDVSHYSIFRRTSTGQETCPPGTTGTFPFCTPVTQIPEPSTLALLGLAFAGFAAIRRRRVHD